VLHRPRVDSNRESGDLARQAEAAREVIGGAPQACRRLPFAAGFPPMREGMADPNHGSQCAEPERLLERTLEVVPSSSSSSVKSPKRYVMSVVESRAPSGT
jgi:hypothetical protein